MKKTNRIVEISNKLSRLDEAKLTPKEELVLQALKNYQKKVGDQPVMSNSVTFEWDELARQSGDKKLGPPRSNPGKASIKMLDKLVEKGYAKKVGSNAGKPTYVPVK